MFLFLGFFEALSLGIFPVVLVYYNFSAKPKTGLANMVDLHSDCFVFGMNTGSMDISSDY